MSKPTLLAGVRLGIGLLAIVVAVFSAQAAPQVLSDLGQGRLIWQQNFNTGTLPSNWKVAPRGFLAVVREKPGSTNFVLTNKGSRRNLQVHFRPGRPNYRIEWRSYFDPAHPQRFGGIGNIRELAPSGTGRRWDARLKFDEAANMIRLTSVDDYISGRSDRVLETLRTRMPTTAGWHSYAIEKLGREIVLGIDGKWRHANTVLPSSMLDPDSRVTLLLRPGAKIDDLRLYDLSQQVHQDPGGMRMAYYPSLNQILCAVYANTLSVDRARVILRDAHGKALLQQTIPVQTGTMIAKGVWQRNLPLIKLPDLADGSYELVAQLRDGQGHWQEVAQQRFERKRFVWQGNRLGITNKVLPPFTPIQVDGREVSVVLRRYRLTGLGLIDQVWAKGQNTDEGYHRLLAAPIRLIANGKTLTGTGKFVSRAPNKLVYNGKVATAAVTAELRNTIEEDGVMRIELTLAPGSRRKTLNSLSLEVPMRNVMAPLWHLGTRDLRRNPAGRVPEGTGLVWDSRMFRENRGHTFYGNFHPYLWLGQVARGLCWFADNDRNWVLDFDPKHPSQSAPSMELVRDPAKSTLTLRINFVQKPIRLDQPRTIIFGLMATPAKPMPKGWRAIGRHGAPRIQFSMSLLYGVPSSYGGKYPLDRDFSPFDFIQANRLGDHDSSGFETLKAHFINRWIDRHLAGRVGADDTVRDAFRNRMSNGLGRYRAAGSNILLTMYFDEGQGTSIFESEVPVYYSEWNAGQWMPSYGHWHILLRRKPGKVWQWGAEWLRHWRIRSINLTRSYRDFAAWYGAEWLRRGIGLYFDNTFPHYITDPLVSDAYFLPNGRVQPSAGIWAWRAYLRRIWTLHRQLYLPKTPQVMMLHMTNTNIAPYMDWSEANLDLEWKDGAKEMFQQKFSPALLRAESTGRQTGTIPVALARMVKGKGQMTPQWYEAKKNKYARSRQMGLLVHEIKPGITTGYYPTPVEKFGYGLPDCKVFNYWEDNPPLHVSDHRAKWLLLERNGELMIVLCTWNPKPADVTLNFDAKALGVTLHKAIDAESGVPINLYGTRVAVHIGGYGSRIILLK